MMTEGSTPSERRNSRSRDAPSDGQRQLVHAQPLGQGATRCLGPDDDANVECGFDDAEDATNFTTMSLSSPQGSMPVKDPN